MKVSKIISLSCAQLIRARVLAEQFSLPFIDATDLVGAKSRDVERFIRSQLEHVKAECSYFFLFSDEGLALVQINQESLLSIRADFYSPTVNYRRHKGGGKGQMIAKAVGFNSGQAPSVLDATAGLGGDAFVLASLGCQLTMTERVLEVRALLGDGLRVAKEWGAVHDEPLVEILDRMQLVDSDAVSYLEALDDLGKPDVVYLDPMFPARSKSAQVKKEMHVFHQLVGTDPDADELLELACAKARKRVVVKRPRIAPLLADTKPSYALGGKSNRFDIYVCG
ncbi:class I SAM-dependent methyltransferase [Coraliomargarita sp. W4R53]